MIISKELLSEVLGEPLNDVSKEDDTVFYKDYNPIKKRYCNGYIGININDLAHKCKIWAISSGYILFSSAYKESGLCLIIEDSSCATIDDAIIRVKQKTEPEAIFKACDYIFKELLNAKD